MADLANEIAGVPPELRRRSRMGFGVLSTLPGEVRDRALRSIFESVSKGAVAIDGDMIADATGVSKQDASYLVASITVILGLFIGREIEVSVDEFIRLGREQLFSERDTEAAAMVVKTVADQRSSWTQIIERQYLVAETLPSLIAFDVSVDLRMRFVKEEVVKDAVPVAVVHINTDAVPELWLQLSLSDVDLIIEKLGRISRQMTAAEEIFKKMDRSR